MSNIDHRYAVQEVPDPQMPAFLFFSNGQNEHGVVLKIIQYSYVQHSGNKPVYNLGFGDLDLQTGEVDDEAITGNGDAYRVFNTVLSTIPEFYKKHPGNIILVQGSDGREAFEATCRINCIRSCGESCHKYNRRMKTYCNYVSRKYFIFQLDYRFLGGIRNTDNWFDFEDFIPGKLYDAIMIFQKKA